MVRLLVDGERVCTISIEDWSWALVNATVYKPGQPPETLKTRRELMHPGEPLDCA